MAREVDIGDDVTLAVTVIKRLDSGRLRVSIPSYEFPCSIEAPPGAKVGDKLHVTGEVTHVDDEAGRVTVRLGGLATVDVAAIDSWTKAWTRAKPLLDVWD